MVIVCPNPAMMKLDYISLRRFALQDAERLEKNQKRALRRANQWMEESATAGDAIKLINSVSRMFGSQPYLQLRSIEEDADPIPLLWEPVQTSLYGTFAMNQGHFVGQETHPASMFEIGLGIVDSLAFGANSMADMLASQGRKLLDERAFARQKATAEDKALPDEEKEHLTIIPSRVFPFALELMSLGMPILQWDEWDVWVDEAYITAARAVVTADLDEAAETLCTLANLHIEHSNPFPDGNDDDHLAGFEFDTPLRCVWPSEIHAWLRVRQMNGLELPEVEHPLLDQPLGRFPTVPPRPAPSEWFRGVVDALTNFHPRYSALPQLLELG